MDQRVRIMASIELQEYTLGIQVLRILIVIYIQNDFGTSQFSKKSYLI